MSNLLQQPEERSVLAFEDQDGDILTVAAGRDELGQRYVSVTREGTELGVTLTADQQLSLAIALLGFDPTLPPDKHRAWAARKAGEILRSHAGGNIFAPNGYASGEMDAAPVIGLAEWIAYGTTEFAGTVEALAYDNGCGECE